MTYVFGVRIVFWIPFLLSMLIFFMSIYFLLENRIRGFFYNTFKKEKAIKVVLHYATSCYTYHWNLLPKNNQYLIDGKTYIHDDKSMIRSKFGFENEIHFCYNNPNAILYDFDKKNIKFTSEQMTLVKDNDLFVKLLSLQTERNMMMLLMLIVIVNVIMSAVILLKEFGVLDKLVAGK